MSMTQIIALREKRAQKWDAAKAFLNAKTGADGHDGRRGRRRLRHAWRRKWSNLGDEIARLERQAASWTQR